MRVADTSANYDVFERNYFDDVPLSLAVGASQVVIRNNIWNQKSQDMIRVGTNPGDPWSPQMFEDDIRILNNTGYSADSTYSGMSFLSVSTELDPSNDPQLTLANNVYYRPNLSPGVHSFYIMTSGGIKSFKLAANNLWESQGGTGSGNVVYFAGTSEPITWWDSQNFAGGTAADFVQVIGTPSAPNEVAQVALATQTFALPNGAMSEPYLTPAVASAAPMNSTPQQNPYPVLDDFYGNLRPTGAATVGAVQVPPEAPANLQASDSDGVVTLNWIPPQASNLYEANIVGFNIYRSSSPSGPWGAPLNGGNPQASDQYMDTSPPSGTVYYQVTTVDRGGNESTPAGVSVTAPGSISGQVFNDANNNGIEDAGETGQAGMTVFIDANDNGILDAGELTALTDASGIYTFSGLSPATYAVREVVPSGDGETSPLGYVGQVPVIAAQTATGPTFGNVLISSVPMDLSYFLTLARNFGQAGTFASGDLNGDGTVNLADLLLLVRNFGHALPASVIDPALPAAIGVPGAGASRLAARRMR